MSATEFVWCSALSNVIALVLFLLVVEPVLRRLFGRSK